MKLTDTEIVTALKEGKGITRYGLSGFIVKTTDSAYGRFHQYKPNGQYFGSYELCLADIEADDWKILDGGWYIMR